MDDQTQKMLSNYVYKRAHELTLTFNQARKIYFGSKDFGSREKDLINVVASILFKQTSMAMAKLGGASPELYDQLEANLEKENSLKDLESLQSIVEEVKK